DIPSAEAAAETPSEPASQPTRVFPTKESLSSFTVASSAASAGGWLLHTYIFSVVSQAAATIGVAMLIGLSQFLLSTATPDTKPRGIGEGIGLLVLAIINSLQLAAAAVGIQALTGTKP